MQVIPFLKQLTAGGYLAAASVTDIRTKSVPKWLLLLAGLTETLLLAAETAMVLQQTAPGDLRQRLTEGLLSRVPAFVPGVLFLLLFFFAKEQVGCADGLSLLILGAALTPAGIWLALCMALLIAFFYAAALLLLKKSTRKNRLPFLPFLTAGTVIASLLLTNSTL